MGTIFPIWSVNAFPKTMKEPYFLFLIKFSTKFFWPMALEIYIWFASVSKGTTFI